MASASSSMIVGGSSSVTDRTSAAALMSAVVSGRQTSWASTSSKRDLPQRLTGDLITSRAANSSLGIAWVAAA